MLLACKADVKANIIIMSGRVRHEKALPNRSSSHAAVPEDAFAGTVERLDVRTAGRVSLQELHDGVLEGPQLLHLLVAEAALPGQWQLPLQHRHHLHQNLTFFVSISAACAHKFSHF